MAAEWRGYYFDGRTPLRQPAVIRLSRTGLEVIPESGVAAWWPYTAMTQTQGFYDGEQVRLERGGEALVIEDPAFLSDLRRVAAEAGTRFHDPRRRRVRVGLTFLAAVAVIGITGALYLWGIPGLAALVAPRVPVSWEVRLGEAIIPHVAPPEQRCTDPERMRRLNEILATLTRPLPEHQYRLHLIVVDDPFINALAAPGGPIVLFRGLLDLTASAEELAGVLAHEAQHILLRHSTRALLEYTSTGLLLTALTGDATGAMAYGLESARVLGLLRYSRLNEEEADREGMRMLLAAGIDPAGMIAFFESLKKKAGDLPGLLRYVSTHPEAGDRIERLKSLAPESQQNFRKLLPGYDWRDIRKICPTAARAR